MIILMFIIFASCAGSFFVFMSIPSRDTRFNKVTISKAEYLKRWIALILCLIVFSCSLYSFLSCEKKAIASAEKVAYIKTNDNEKLTSENTSPIYFDSETNSYFILEQNSLNPFNAMERRELDFEKTEKYVEIYKQLVDANPYPCS